ncbi:MAG TPA: DUF805 domain-containing protein [Caulobacteraceae bacterium]|jgi:uncharacterized membrane protein YhaH (DUF805 family)|nr:DUF805 domain-containing protein [Caulobacteraceae bacterium]
MDTVLETLKTKYAAFDGRARRKEFWLFVLFNFVVNLIAAVLDQAVLHGSPVLQLLVVLALFVPGLALNFRRLHDIDKSAWWLLIGLIPFIGVIVLLVFAILPGTVGPNRFGPDPKAELAVDPIPA